MPSGVELGDALDGAEECSADDEPAGALHPLQGVRCRKTQTVFTTYCLIRQRTRTASLAGGQRMKEKSKYAGPYKNTATRWGEL